MDLGCFFCAQCRDDESAAPVDAPYFSPKDPTLPFREEESDDHRYGRAGSPKKKSSKPKFTFTRITGND